MTVEDVRAITWLARVNPAHGMTLDSQSLAAVVAMARVLEELMAAGRLRFDDPSPTTP